MAPEPVSRRRRQIMLKKKQAEEVLDLLEKEYPQAECQLEHTNSFQLLVATVLSAQTTDKRVNQVTPELFRRYPDAESLAEAVPVEVEECIREIGMYRTKTRNIIALSEKLVSDFGGEVPADYEALTSLPGVGRKTANVVLSVAFGEQRIAVDTHVFRVSNRIGLVKEKDVLATEEQLMKRLPKNRWSRAHHLLIFHGRYCCSARRPECERCPLRDICEKNL